MKVLDDFIELFQEYCKGFEDTEEIIESMKQLYALKEVVDKLEELLDQLMDNEEDEYFRERYS